MTLALPSQFLKHYLIRRLSCLSVVILLVLLFLNNLTPWLAFQKPSPIAESQPLTLFSLIAGLIYSFPNFCSIVLCRTYVNHYPRDMNICPNGMVMSCLPSSFSVSMQDDITLSPPVLVLPASAHAPPNPSDKVAASITGAPKAHCPSRLFVSALYLLRQVSGHSPFHHCAHCHRSTARCEAQAWEETGWWLGTSIKPLRKFRWSQGWWRMPGINSSIQEAQSGALPWVWSQAGLHDETQSPTDKHKTHKSLKCCMQI